MQLFASWTQAFWSVMLEAGLWLIVGFLIAGAIRTFIPTGYLRRWLGGSGLGSIARASAIGVPMPLCSCSVIPAAASLRRAGASRGASTAFLVSTPEADAPSISITWAIIGPAMAIARPVVALATAIAAGVGVERFARSTEASSNGEAAPDAQPERGCCAEEGGGPSVPGPGSSVGVSSAAGRARGALRHVLVELPHDLGHWMLIGLALSAVVMVLVPDGWIEQHLEAGALGPFGLKLLMLVVGVPTYVCATSSTPLAAALIAKGLSPGAALVFLLAGPATNPATMAWVLGDLGKRALAIYLAIIAAAALAAGVAFDAVLPAGWTNAAPLAEAHHSAGPVRQVAAAALTLLLLSGVIRRLLAWATSLPKRSAARRSRLRDTGSSGMTSTASGRPGSAGT